MVITLLIIFPITLLLIGLLVLYAVYMGLKWNFQTKVELKPPESPLPPNPVALIKDELQEKKSENILYEWLNGSEKREGAGT